MTPETPRMRLTSASGGVELASPFGDQFGDWCNGSTADSGSVSPSSNLGSPVRTSPQGLVFFCAAEDPQGVLLAFQRTLRAGKFLGGGPARGPRRRLGDPGAPQSPALLISCSPALLLSCSRRRRLSTSRTGFAGSTSLAPAPRPAARTRPRDPPTRRSIWTSRLRRDRGPSRIRGR
jgi:hypothetical protein